MTWVQRLKRVFNIDIETCSSAACRFARVVVMSVSSPASKRHELSLTVHRFLIACPRIRHTLDDVPRQPHCMVGGVERPPGHAASVARALPRRCQHLTLRFVRYLAPPPLGQMASTWAVWALCTSSARKRRPTKQTCTGRKYHVSPAAENLGYQDFVAGESH